MVEKKWIKIAIAGIAATALIIGLSVGISQSQSRNRVASSAYGYGDIDGYTCGSKSAKATYSPSYAGPSKSGKSDGGGGTSKSGKSSSSPTVDKNYGRRLIVVPGTEDYRRVNLGLGGKRINTRRGLGAENYEKEPTPSPSYSKSGKSGGSKSTGGGSKGSKSYSHEYNEYCEVDPCGKAGKSSGSKGSKSGYEEGYSKSGKSGYSKGGKGSSCFGSKSGGSKSSKSGYDYDSETDSPTVSCSPTIAPSICEEECGCDVYPEKWFAAGTSCIRLNETDVCIDNCTDANLSGECQQYEPFHSKEACCDFIEEDQYGDGGYGECGDSVTIEDQCSPEPDEIMTPPPVPPPTPFEAIIPETPAPVTPSPVTPAPFTPAPTESTPAPTESTPAPTYSTTEGSTPTVAEFTTGPPTVPRS